jgi:hypothetical protein
VQLVGLIFELLWDEGTVGWWFRRVALVGVLLCLLVLGFRTLV